uniref:coiled-coil and C2 domain-containing protein 1B-like n=1 Tax=Jaculus jaculus TaxID=51337 RepID=UPI001E1B4E84|nr:coiled-coil and C2 domain-containing protein 1B-like [Jaculus jaculus]
MLRVEVELGMVTHTCDLSTWKAEAKELPHGLDQPGCPGRLFGRKVRPTGAQRHAGGWQGSRGGAAEVRCELREVSFEGQSPKPCSGSGVTLGPSFQKCLLFSKQFMHQGNVAETTRFEKLAQDRKKQLQILQLARAQGLDPPSHHFEVKTFQTVRIFSELNSTEMHLIIVRAMNLPAPPGVTPDDLDAFVRFEFHYPNSDQAQKSKTAVVKNTNSPEFDQVFKLNINRNHCGFRRVIQSKGLKFEILHKGSFFKSDKLVGTSHLRLERLEKVCEIREILEVLNGRKPILPHFWLLLSPAVAEATSSLCSPLLPLPP